MALKLIEPESAVAGPLKVEVVDGAQVVEDLPCDACLAEEGVEEDFVSIGDGEEGHLLPVDGEYWKKMKLV